MRRNPLYFDKEDYDLLAMVNNILERKQKRSRDELLFAPELHPHGIKELAVAREILVAYAVMNLLDSLEAGEASDRILALRSLHDEALSAAASSFRYNTGRVLIQIMKDLVRAHGDEDRQLMLARDFRAASTGKHSIIRAMLQRYHLLEMPEEWDQLTFDNHVHDANTKGRKTPTHLIMDAWIKGIRQLTVIYYNFVEPRAVRELMQAAAIMGIDVRIGLEFKALFRGRHIDFIWEPVGLGGAKDMAQFLEEEAMRQLMRDGREASAFTAQYVFRMVDRYNTVHRDELAALFSCELPVITRNEFLAFVAAGQPSLEHLAELVYQQIFPLLLDALPQLRARYANAAAKEEKEAVEAAITRMRNLHPESIMESYFTPGKNPGLLPPETPDDTPDMPDFLRTTALELVTRLNAVRPMSRIVLTLSGLRAEDALELLYACEGRITHLELFNLKDFVTGKMPHYKAITELLYAVNQGSAFALKRIIRGIIRDYSEMAESSDERRGLLTEILRNIPKLQSFYQKTPLKPRVGSDSTSRSYRLHGMGFAFIESLPRSARNAIRNSREVPRKVLPFRTEIDSVYTYSAPSLQGVSAFRQAAGAFLRALPGFSLFGCAKKHGWEPRTPTTRYTEKENASIATLGGLQREMPDVFHLQTKAESGPKLGTAYLNTKISNFLKVLTGFLLAFGAFSVTQEWWVLAWFGAPIWFAITGLRNIVQAVLGGGGFSRTPLLRWNDYVSWSRICDSLLYTGISVPLLELFLRWWLLGQVCGISAATTPILFYTVISAANGLYIASHNTYRGLQREAVVGNLFRSVLAIPLALLYNAILMGVVTAGGIAGGIELLIASSAIVSKAASDTVAGIIEGIADQNTNLRMRAWDYTRKLGQFFACLARLEVLLPEENVPDLLRMDKERQPLMMAEIYLLQDALIIHSLDLMYFWMYQPRARTLLARLLREMTVEERDAFVLSQAVLYRTKEISRMFVDGMLGDNFSRPLTFFLNSHTQYLADIAQVSGVGIPKQ